MKIVSVGFKCDACGARITTEQDAAFGANEWPERWGRLHPYHGSTVPGGDLCPDCMESIKRVLWP